MPFVDACVSTCVSSNHLLRSWPWLETNHGSMSTPLRSALLPHIYRYWPIRRWFNSWFTRRIHHPPMSTSSSSLAVGTLYIPRVSMAAGCSPAMAVGCLSWPPRCLPQRGPPCRASDTVGEVCRKSGTGAAVGLSLEMIPAPSFCNQFERKY